MGEDTKIKWEVVPDEPKWPEGPEMVKEGDVTVKDMLGRVHGMVDEFKDDIDEEFEKELERQLKAKRNGFFIVPNKFWDAWFQKIFAQAISIKIWVLALITVLLVKGYINSAEFAVLFGVIMGLKGVFQTASVWKKNGNGDLHAVDKT
jgi:hypothetical protein